MTEKTLLQPSAFSFQPSLKKWLVCAFLGLAVLVVYWQALSCTFVNFDDGDYVTLNPNIQHGLNWQSLKWAFTSGYAANWHPITWVSHIIDYQLYRLEPRGHHLTSLLLHLANTILLFLLLNRLTGVRWPSAWVAAIFALHPLRVESVVWVAERKDVLSTFFWMLTVGAYVRYAKITNYQLSIVNYCSALVFFALGLMSKSMLVTLPFVLLLLDYWPLGRLELGPKFSWRLVAEKIPFFLLAIGASAITFLVQNHSGVVASLSTVSLSDRLANVPMAYVRYLGKIVWPSGLAVFYGYEHWNFYQVAGALLLLCGMTAFVVWRRRTQPYLAVGWFWFLGMLLPTIGLVQVGHQSMADRYTYLPSVGISLMVAWGLHELALGRSGMRRAMAAAGALAIVACAAGTRHQIEFWKNPVALFARAAEVSYQDCQTCYNVGCEVMQQGNFPRAVKCFERALEAARKNDPPSLLARVQNNLACALLEQGQITNAVDHLESALKLQPRYPQAYYNMGRAFMTNGQPQVAVDCFQQALALDQSPAVLGALAAAYAQAGNFAEAVAAAQHARQLALAQKNTALAESLELQLQKYQASARGPHP